MDKDLRSLDWSRVQAFVAVAQTGSLSAAARRLGVSQPTLGRQIKAVEAELSVTLFQRQPRGLTLTDTGAALLAPAQAMAEAARHMELAAAGRTETMEGTVRITASVVIAMHFLPPIIAKIRRAYPMIQIEISATDAAENLLFREADIALRMYRPEQLDIVARHIANLQMGICAAQSYLKGRSLPEDITDFLGVDLVGYDKDERIIRGMRDYGLHVTRGDFGTRCDDHNVLWAMLQAGCGVGFGPVRLIEDTPGLVQLAKGIALDPLPVWLTAHEVMRQTPRIRRVWDILAADLPPLLGPPS